MEWGIVMVVWHIDPTAGNDRPGDIKLVIYIGIKATKSFMLENEPQS